MKLRMDVLKSNIGSKSVELVKFIRKEIEEVSFAITVDMDYRMVMKPAYGSLYSTSVIDTVTKEVKDEVNHRQRFFGHLERLYGNDIPCWNFVWDEDNKVFNYGWDKYGRLVKIDLGIFH